MRPIAAIALSTCLIFMIMAGIPAKSKPANKILAAQSAFKAGDYKKAISGFSSIISAGKYGKATLAQAFYYRGIAFQRSGKPIEALADYTNALWLEGLPKPASAQCLIRRGYLRLELNQTDSAVEDMNSAVRTHADAESYIARAGVMVKTGQAELALQDLDSAEKLNPNRRWMLHLVRAEALEALGRRDEARTHAKQAIELNPDRNYKLSRQLYVRLGGKIPQQVASSRVPPVGLVTGSIPRKGKAAKTHTSADWVKATTVHRAAPVKTFRKPAPATKASRKTALSATGDYVVQLSASSSLDAAKRAIHRIANRNKPLLAGHDLFVVRGMSRTQQEIYRVRLGPFANRSQPADLCARLKSAGQDCFVTRR